MTGDAQQQQVPLFKDSNAFTSFSVKDVQRAKEFYGQTLGIEVSESEEGLQLKLGDGHPVFIYPKPNHEPATYTVLNFEVNDIEKSVNELYEHGISLEHYDLPGMKTDEDGIFRTHGPKIAWFKDPDGNILSVFEKKK